MNRAEAVERAATSIAGTISRDFADPEAAWASQALRAIIVPAMLAGQDEIEPADLDGDVTAAIEALEAESADERYANLVLRYFASLLAPTADAAYVLARQALETGRTAPVLAGELANELAELAEAMDASAPDLEDGIFDRIGEALLDCAWASGDFSQPSRRIAIDQAMLAEDAEKTARIGSPEPEIDALAAQARAALATSFEAAKIAVNADVVNRNDLLAIRTIYDLALDTLDKMTKTFGADAVRRVSNDFIRADLVEALEAPITPEEWDEDTTGQGILTTRLSRSL